MENMKLKIQEKTREKVQLETHIAREEARVAEIGTTLATYKREIHNCRGAAERLGAEEVRLGREASEKEEVADKLEKEVRQREQEAERYFCE